MRPQVHKMCTSEVRPRVGAYNNPWEENLTHSSGAKLVSPHLGGSPKRTQKIPFKTPFSYASKLVQIKHGLRSEQRFH